MDESKPAGPRVEMDVRERAALYVLGLMSPEEMRRFEQLLRDGDPEALLAMRQLSATEPPVSLKARLIRRVAHG